MLLRSTERDHEAEDYYRTLKLDNRGHYIVHAVPLRYTYPWSRLCVHYPGREGSGIRGITVSVYLERVIRVVR
jgi:hypothetical protein